MKTKLPFALLSLVCVALSPVFATDVFITSDTTRNSKLAYKSDTYNFHIQNGITMTWSVGSGNPINALEAGFDDTTATITINSGGGAANSGTLLFTNNRNGSQHGSALHGGGYADISNVVFTNNSSAGLGGAVDWWAGDIAINNSTFINNQTPTKGGAVNIHNIGNTPIRYTAFVINNSTFINNRATNAGGLGGAVSLWFDATPVHGVINSSTFVGNLAGNGGAIYGSSADYLTINNSVFTSNTANTTGGAIRYVGTTGPLTVQNSTFTGNVAGSGNGGAISIPDSLFVIASSTFANNTSGANGGAIFGQGSGTIGNSTFTGNQANNGGAVFVGNLGTLTLVDTSLTNNTAGSNGGALYLTGTRTAVYRVTTTGATISGNRAAKGGVAFLASSSTLQFDVQSGATLTINEPGDHDGLASANATPTYQKTGDGTLKMYVNNSDFTGKAQVTGGVLQVRGASDIGSVSGTLEVRSGGTLSFKDNTAPVTVTRTLTGAGLVTADLQNQSDAFGFAATTGSNFTGTVAMKKSTFDLSGNNTAALSKATLSSGSGNVTTVGSGTQKIGNLALNGGFVRFGTTLPTDTVSPAVIEAVSGTLEIADSVVTKIGVNPTSIPIVNPPSAPNSGIVAQSSTVAVMLVKADTVAGSTGSLELADMSGNAIQADVSYDIQQGGQKVAVSHYGYGLATHDAKTSQNGLFVTYGLQEVEIADGKTLDLAPENNQNEFTAKITGNGNLGVSSGSSFVLGNLQNSYSGNTTVDSGTLVLATNNALGNTKELALNGNASLDLNGVEVEVQKINGQSNGVINLNEGSLTVQNGGIINEQIIGTGTVTQNGGNLALNNQNNNYAGVTNVNAGELQAGAERVLSPNADYRIGQTGTLNLNGYSQTVASLDNNGALVFGGENKPRGTNLTVTNNLSGNGAIYMKTNIASNQTIGNDGNSDHLTVGAVTGTYRLVLKDVGAKDTSKAQPLELISSGGPNTGKVSGGVSKGLYKYTVALGQEVKAVPELNANDYYLVNSKLLGGGADNLGDLGKVIADTGAGRSLPWFGGDAVIDSRFMNFQYSAFDNGNFDPTHTGKRSDGDGNDNRSGKEVDVWVQASGGQYNVDGKVSGTPFGLGYYGMTVGADRFWMEDRNNVALAGAFVGYGYSDYSYHLPASGSVDSYTGGLYASWLHRDGWYADGILKAAYMDTKFDVWDDLNDHTKASYNGLAGGLSLEFGKRFFLQHGAFFEPMVQLSGVYFLGDSYNTTGAYPMSVKVDDSFVGRLRAGFTTGTVLKLDQGSYLQPYLRVSGMDQFPQGGTIHAEGDSYRPKLEGLAGEGALGLLWQIDPDNFLKFEYEAIFAESYTQPWGLTLGYRHQF